jgi:BatD DUF11 like domain
MKTFFSINKFLILLVGICSISAHAQQIQVLLGPDEIGENQAWTITVTVQNDRLKSYDNFPDIPGFKKRGTSSQSSTNIINGQISSSQSIVMTYLPTQQGMVTVPSFSMTINGTKMNMAGKKVRVGPAIQRQQQNDPLSRFFNRDQREDFFGRGETEFIDIKEDAFLALTTGKDEVYVGEGFTTTLAFYVSEGNQAPLQFYELGKQLADILKKIKPATCWEENFNIENIEGESITISGKDYTQYKIYQAVYYPLNTEPVKFPSVGLEMIKYKVAKNPSFYGQNRQEDFKTFYSKPKTVIVKDLPAHPLKDAAAVGDYRLEEKLTNTEVQTGQSFSYQFSIYGEGNISSIEKPTLVKTPMMEFYEPNVRQDIARDNGRVTGTKSFNYFLIPREPGEYKLSDFFQWVFFNPKTSRYDTLISNAVVRVTGESMKDEEISANDLGGFYDKIPAADNTLQKIDNTNWLNIIAYTVMALSLILSTYLMFKRT